MARKPNPKSKNFSFTKELILLTGGTGSFGSVFVETLLASKKFRGVIRVFSRDEFKQYNLQKKMGNDPRLRFFIGDIRDRERLELAMHGVDVVVHAAALKQVPILEYNPFEAVKTNVLGSQNVIDAAIGQKVKKVLLISSDKAVAPVNLYGATKMVAEKIFIQANSYSVGVTKFSVARYGNVVGSRGSVVPVFLEQAKNNLLTITDENMTRFWISLKQGVEFVINCVGKMQGGEIFVPKIPSVKVTDLAKAIAPGAKIKIVGIRPGEKIHEVLLSIDEARHAIDLKDSFVIEPEFVSWRETKNKRSIKRPPKGFFYTSDNNDWWLKISEVKEMLKLLDD